jgi:hypothetical protein
MRWHVICKTRVFTLWSLPELIEEIALYLGYARVTFHLSHSPAGGFTTS